MGSAKRNVKSDAQKRIVEMLEKIAKNVSLWNVWQDFVVMSAIAISNAIPSNFRKNREEEYISMAKKYSKEELEMFSSVFYEVVCELDRNPNQDLLGDMFMALELGNHWKGQFFTPYQICELTAELSYSEAIKKDVDEHGWASVNDPACGAGALLIAYANQCRKCGINYQTSILFVAQDIDFLAGCMCYIQLSLLGCPGYVVIGDTLLNPAQSLDKRGLIPMDTQNVWYTPMYCAEIWQSRCIWNFIAEGGAFGDTIRNTVGKNHDGSGKKAGLANI